jgi:competence protein ComEA
MRRLRFIIADARTMSESHAQPNSTSPDGAPPRQLSPWLRRADMVAIAAIVITLLVAIEFYWFARGGHRGDLIDVEQAPPLEATFQVDINTAPWHELAVLPGVGESLARRIVEVRERNGRFQSHDDLRRVRGIGDKLMEKIRPHLLPIEELASTD